MVLLHLFPDFNLGLTAKIHEIYFSSIAKLSCLIYIKHDNFAIKYI